MHLSLEFVSLGIFSLLEFVTYLWGFSSVSLVLGGVSKWLGIAHWCMENGVLDECTATAISELWGMAFFIWG